MQTNQLGFVTYLNRFIHNYVNEMTLKYETCCILIFLLLILKLIMVP